MTCVLAKSIQLPAQLQTKMGKKKGGKTTRELPSGAPKRDGPPPIREDQVRQLSDGTEAVNANSKQRKAFADVCEEAGKLLFEPLCLILSLPQADITPTQHLLNLMEKIKSLVSSVRDNINTNPRHAKLLVKITQLGEPLNVQNAVIGGLGRLLYHIQKEPECEIGAVALVFLLCAAFEGLGFENPSNETMIWITTNFGEESRDDKEKFDADKEKERQLGRKTRLFFVSKEKILYYLSAGVASAVLEDPKVADAERLTSIGIMTAFVRDNAEYLAAEYTGADIDDEKWQPPESLFTRLSKRIL